MRDDLSALFVEAGERDPVKAARRRSSARRRKNSILSSASRRATAVSP